MSYAINIKNLNKTYNSYKALDNINFAVKKGEIFSLLGPNGAGKSTLINIICGITKKNSGDVYIFGHDIIKEYKNARSLIGLVPQEIATDSFEKVINTLKFSRGLFNKPPSKAYLEKLLKQLSLYDKKDQQLRTLSGGMRRRVMIAKALSHEPQILFLDEPTAGVDVELRKELWKTLSQLKKNGTTIFLTTHYIEEAEKIADRVGIINDGKIIIVEEKKKLIDRLGEKTLTLRLKNENRNLIKIIKKYDIKKHNNKLIITFNKNNKKISPSNIIKELAKNSISFNDIEIEKTNLEQIFLGLIEK
ncbi:MAG: ABC transporter ATP-binding protein [Alphaproteobacteria bacterium]